MESHYDLVVIGSGPAGEKGAARAAYEGKRVAMVEESSLLGGTMAGQGVSVKTLRETAINISGILKRDLYGIDLRYKDDLDVQTFMHRERQVQETVQQTVAENMARHGVRIFQGCGSFVDPHTIRIVQDQEEKQITADVVLITTGSRPVRPAAFPFQHPSVYDSTTVMEMHQLPASLIVVGGGIVGCEFACLFAALGIPVQLIHPQQQLLPFIDQEIGQSLVKGMSALGIALRLGQRVVNTVAQEGSPRVRVRLDTGEEIESDALLVAVGRASNTENLQLENAGVRMGERGLIQVNQFLQTNIPHIYAAGDVIGFPSLASTGMEQGRMAVTHAFGFELSINSSQSYSIWSLDHSRNLDGRRNRRNHASERSKIPGW